MPKLENIDKHLYPKKSYAMTQWGAFIRSLTRAGPNERQDPETGEWGTKAQVLGRLYAARDEQDKERPVIDDTDACIEMLECVYKMTMHEKYLLCGYWMHFDEDMRLCLQHIPSQPERNLNYKYYSRRKLVDDIDAATRKAEQIYRELYHDKQVKRVRLKQKRLEKIEAIALEKLKKLK